MRWTKQEDKTLRMMRGYGASLSKIAEKLGRSESAVCQRAIRTLGLSTQRAPKQFWTPKEIKTLRDLFPTTTCATIGTMIGRTAQSVRDRAKHEKLYRRDYPL